MLLSFNLQNYIGRGVFATEPFKKGDFLLQYRGERITGSEGEHREKNYPDEAGNFLYFFKDLHGTYWYVYIVIHILGNPGTTECSW